MTQPSPQDDLPSGPWSVGWEDTADGPEWFVEHTNSHTTIAYGLESEPIARAIAAIPEMRAELERRQLIIDAAMAGDIDRLRSEKAELQKQNDALRGDYPRNIGVEITEAFTDNQRLRAEIERWDETDPLVNKRLKEDLHEILTLRREKTELIEMLATRTTHPEYVELLRRYKPENETEGK